MATKTLQKFWKKLGFQRVPVCEICQAEPATSFSFFEDPLETLRVKTYEQEHPRTFPKPITGASLKQLVETRELAEELDLQFAPYIPKMLCRLAGNCTRLTERYYVMFDSFFESPLETLDWLNHLHQKSWMNWSDFNKAMKRLCGMVR